MPEPMPHSPLPAEVPAELFRQAVEQSALAISITDPQAGILYCNPAFQRVTGYAQEEVLGRNESILSYKVTPKLVYESMWAQLLRQRPWNGMLVNRRKDGSRYLAELTITPVVNGEGRTSHYLGLHRDVTEMHRLERQVQNQKALIESVVDAAPVAMAMLDASEHVVLDNQEYKKLIGVLGPEPALTLLAALRADLADDHAAGRGFDGREVRHVDSAGQVRWFACSGSSIEEQDGSADAFYAPSGHTYLLLVIQDITALKAQQEAIRVNALRAMLAEQERIQSLRETLSGALFQLQTPFNMLAAAVRMIERQPAGIAEALAASLEEALRKGTTTLDTLRACVPSPAEETVGPVDLNASLKDLLRLATPRLLADGITVAWQPGELPLISGRATRLTMLFKALLDNAIEAIHEARGQRREISVASLAGPDWVEVSIEDSGPGIPEEWRYKVFEPFFTTKGADRQHIGMGLSSAQEVVTSHGGLIDLAESALGGCRARVQLPVN